MIHLIVGNTGAGKTTYASQLQKENGGVIFSIDQWNQCLFMADKKEDDGLDWWLERIDREETLIMKLVEQLEAQKLDAILDLGFSKYDHRQKFRDFAVNKGFDLQLHFLKVSKEERWKRVRQRNSEKGDSYEFEVTQEQLEFMEKFFEVPTKDEIDGNLS